LMGMIALQYLGPRAARREQRRPAPVSRPAPPRGGTDSAHVESDPLDEVDMRLTYRTARVLECIAELGGRGSGPSNRAVAESAGVTDPGQISKLLRRLERLGLAVNTGGGHQSGEPNAWRLTPRGEKLEHAMRVPAALTGRVFERSSLPKSNHACVAPSAGTFDSLKEG
jgi:DNA-binding MarR family transcriptional regulator